MIRIKIEDFKVPEVKRISFKEQAASTVLSKTTVIYIKKSTSGYILRTNSAI